MKIEMVFRCWVSSTSKTESEASEPPPRDPGLVSLIEDVAAARNGVVVFHEDQLYVTGLRLPADALVVSRQVQLALLGFLGEHHAAPTFVSIALDVSAPVASTFQPEQDCGAQLEDSRSSTPNSSGGDIGPSHDLLTLLKLSKPAQILVTHDFCEQLAAIRGLPLKPFPGRFGVCEYLWTSEDQLTLLQSQPQLTLLALPVARPAKQLPKEVKKAVSQPDAADFGTEVTDLRKQSSGPLERWRDSRRSPRFLVLAAVAFVAIVGAAVAGIRLAHMPPSPSANPGSTGKRTSALPNVGMAPAGVTNGASPPESRAIQQRNSASGSPLATHAVAQTQKKSYPAAKPEPAASAPAAQPCTLAGAPSRYVKLAEQYRGRGDYANAVRIFRQIVDCDPDNALAREGLSRALQGQEQGRRQP